jgi:nicotinamide phosphoribosyltransferase
MTNQSILLNTDSYKASMFKQYPPGTTKVWSYIESRGGKWDDIVFFGLQAFIQEYISKQITVEDVVEAKEIWEAHGEPFNYDGWMYIVNNHRGLLPLEICAVPEGTIVPTGNVLATIVNTDDNVPWLCTWVETALLRAIWYCSTVATNSREIKKLIAKYMLATGADMSTLPFKLHDFGARGASSNESAMLGGMAHLVNFMGTDTIAAVVGAKRYYGEKTAGFSIPAAEHSTITSWGKENEVEAYRNMLTQFAKPGSLVAVVSDSYDIYNAVENLWGGELKQQVIDSGATLVIRPDSGDPATVVLQVAQLLDQTFGSTFNEKAFKVLNHVRIIQGDGINHDSIAEILSGLYAHGFSADNVAFGMGGALLQAPQRDDQSWAMKCSAIEVNGQWRDVFKDPLHGGKKSKAGRLKLIELHGIGTSTWRTVRQDDEEFARYPDMLRRVYAWNYGNPHRPTSFTRRDTFAAVRERAKIEVGG